MPKRWVRRWHGGVAARFAVEPLESRRMLSVGATPPQWPLLDTGAPASFTHPISIDLASTPVVRASAAPLNEAGLPLLHSLPGGRAAVFLDFDGNGALLPFDTDGIPSSFNASERSVIELAWRHLSSYFSMFDLDVTTEQPTSVPYSYSIVSNSITTVAYNYGSFPDGQPVSFHPPTDAGYRQTALAHEAGHSFGLGHQAAYDNRGNRTAEYSEGLDRLHGALMGVDYAREVHKWFIGHPHISPAALQDDVAMIAARVRAYVGGDGFRPDDVPGTFESAVPLAPGEAGRYTASGIIERLSDADAYRFESAGSSFRLDLVPPAPSMLDGKLEVYASDGSLVAAADGVENHQHLALPWLEPGTYYAVVRSHGNYADLGPYDLAVQATPGGVAPQPPSRPAPRLEAAQGTAVSVEWDAAAGATGYAIERSDDGAAWQVVGTMDAPATAFTDQPPLGGHRYFYRVVVLAESVPPTPSAAAHVVNHPAPVTALLSTGLNSGFVLNWRDTSGETGYRIYRRSEPAASEPGPWLFVGEVGPNIPSYHDEGRPVGEEFRYRVAAVAPDGAETSAEVETLLPATEVTGLRAAVIPGTSTIRVEWDPIERAVGYRLERASIGTDFVSLGTFAATTYYDQDLEPATMHRYRVIGTNAMGHTLRSATVSAFLPGTPLPEGWEVASVGGAPAEGAAAYRQAGDRFSVVGGGYGLLTPEGRVTSGTFRFVYRTLTGDGTISAQITPDNVGGALAGIMFRQADPGGRYVFAGIAHPHGRGVAALGGPSSDPFFVRTGNATPMTMRIERAADTFRVYEGLGHREISLGSFTVPMGATVQVGLVYASGTDDSVAAARFDQVEVAPSVPFVQAVSASPRTVRTTSTVLRVSAHDLRPESTLTYTWSVTSQPAGVPPPTFSVNGANEAKSTTATFFGVGRYVFRATATNVGGATDSSTVEVNVLTTPRELFIAPATPTIRAGGALTLTATGIDQFGTPLEAAPTTHVQPAAWYSNHGVIQWGDGLWANYTAPAFPGWDSVLVTIGGYSTSTSVFVYDDATPAVLSVASRKTHGATRVVDLPLVLYGAPAVVEPRRGGPTTLVFTFSGDVSPADGSLGANDFNLYNATFRSARLDGRILTLELADVLDVSIVYAGIAGLVGADGNGLLCDADVEIFALHGDADRDGVVNAADVFALRSLRPAPGATDPLLYDLDLDGLVSASDQVIVRRRMPRPLLAELQAVPAPRAAPARRSTYG